MLLIPTTFKINYRRKGVSGVFHNQTTSKASADVMSTHTGRRHSPQGKHRIAGTIHGDAQAQHGAAPGRADGVNRPFPNKPVSHRRSHQPRKQESFDPCDLEKMAITKPKEMEMHKMIIKEHSSNGTRKPNGAQDPRNESDGSRPRGELQMARAIHAKELMLQEKLWNIEEKIRHKFQRDTADRRSEEQRRNWGQLAERGNTETTSRLAEQQRREMKIQERRQETHYQEERARGKRMEIEVAQLHKKDYKATRQITVPEQEVSGELNKPRWGKVKELTRRKERDGNVTWGATGVKSQDGRVKAKESHHSAASMGDARGKRESNYGIHDEEQDVPHTSQQKTSHRAAAEGRKRSGGARLPPVSQPSPSTRPPDPDASLQLLPCTFCNRKFASERLQKHVQICERVKQSQRGVFNTYRNRTKGSAIEEFWKTHSKSPEVGKKKNQRRNQVNTRHLHEGRLPAGTAQPKWSK